MDDSQIELLDNLIDRIYSLIKLSVLFSNGKKSVLNLIDFDFNIRNILNKGKGIFSELTSKHIVLNGYPPRLMNIIDIETDETKINNEEKKLLQNYDYKLFYGKKIDRNFHFFFI